MADTDRFITATARALIDRHGIEAAFVASLRADAKLRAGDTDGARIWREVRKEVERLQEIVPEGRAKH